MTDREFYFAVETLVEIIRDHGTGGRGGGSCRARVGVSLDTSRYQREASMARSSTLLSSPMRQRAATFLPSGEGPRALIWNAYSDACNDGQLRRVKEFLFAPGAGTRQYPKNPDRGRLHTRTELMAIGEGTPYSAVRAQLGAASMADCSTDGSFTVSWTEDSRPHYREWEFTFNQAQRLVTKRRR